MTRIKKYIASKLNKEPNENNKVKVYTTPSGTRYVNSIDLVLSKKEKKELYSKALEKRATSK